MIRLRPWLLILFAALVYALGHISWYAFTPLGRVPVLDELENLTLANQIADGTLPSEPFYRAMGYPLLLAGLRIAGVSTLQLPLAALLLGIALHALASLLVGELARRWFDDTRAGLVAGLLAALNPGFVHYATQRLDATLGMVLFLAGLLALALERAPPSARALLGATFWWTLAALVRPQFLTVLVALPVFWYWRNDTCDRIRALLGCLTIATALFTAQGFWQRQVGGEFRLLPWQGPYNLWAANQPGAHGRYYAQTLDLPPSASPENPAKLESFALYARATGHALPSATSTPAAIDAMNAHWRARFLDHVLHDPLAWLRQLARKTYAFLNTWEQYNNKTYAFHAARSPWLAWNPLGWGVLLVLAVAGTWRLRVQAPPPAGTVGLIALATSAGVILFFVSARFRLPVAALLCVPAGAALARPAWFSHALSPASRNALLFALIATAVLTFSNLDGVRDTRPFIQDHLLIARAAQTVGDDAEVWSQGAAALVLDPTRRDAAEYIVTSGFNRQLAAPLTPAEFVAWRTHSSRFLALAPPAPINAPARVLAATAARDLVILRALAADPAAPASPAVFDALGALTLLDAATPAQHARLLAAPPTAGTTLFLMARQSLDSPAFDTWAKLHQPPGWSKALATARTRLFPALTHPR
ncbi:MAG: glycosyltransferase family 39 protein [Undibacterium sp.]|nr:glycosyltransferase family 39 protein [Opitutaceae bacterium]